VSGLLVSRGPRSASLRSRPSASRTKCCCQAHRGAGKCDHVTPLLRERHWLPVEQRITFKMAVVTYNGTHGTTADYHADYIRPPSSATANLQLRSTSSGRLFVPRSKTAAWTDPLQLLVHVCGTVCLYLFHIGRLLGHFHKNN